MHRRIEQVNTLFRKELSEYIRKELDIPPGCFITVTKVEITNDLDLARVSLSILPVDQRDRLLNQLKKNIPAIRKILGKKLIIRKIPKLLFLLDETEERAAHIEAIIDKLERGE